MMILQVEVTKLKEILKRLLEDITVQLPMDLKNEMQTSVEMPEVMSPTIVTKARAEMTSNHDFLAQIDYSPK